MKIDQLSKKEKNLLKNKTAESYIEACRKMSIPSGRKSIVTSIWLEKYSKTIEDIKYARNRNKYWKTKKMQGSYDRNFVRMAEHDYSTSKKKSWKETDIKELIDKNDLKDWQLAKYFKVGIASIQARRRSINTARKILLASGKKRVIEKKLVSLALRSDKFLIKQLKEMGKLSS